MVPWEQPAGERAMTDKPKKRHYRFEVRLIETITVSAESEDKARLALANSQPSHPPSRFFDYNAAERILPGNMIRQDQITLIAVVDEPDTLSDRAMAAAWKDFERQLNDNFKEINKRLDALEARGR
jgi:hypothetical protein